jgi:flagellin-like protein
MEKRFKRGKRSQGKSLSLCNFQGNHKRPKSAIFLTENRKGLSPVITTVLLVALTIAIIAIVFLWFKGMVEEGVTKFGKNINLVCDDVDFEASYSSGTLNVANNGNVPIYRINLRLSTEGSYETKDIRELSGGASWPDTGLTQGGTFSGEIGSEIGAVTEITVLPILIGTSSKGKKTFMCGGQYGKELSLA